MRRCIKIDIFIILPLFMASEYSIICYQVVGDHFFDHKTLDDDHSVYFTFKTGSNCKHSEWCMRKLIIDKLFMIAQRSPRKKTNLNNFLNMNNDNDNQINASRSVFILFRTFHTNLHNPVQSDVYRVSIESFFQRP